jgi:hypothetical protein
MYQGCAVTCHLPINSTLDAYASYSLAQRRQREMFKILAACYLFLAPALAATVPAGKPVLRYVQIFILYIFAHFNFVIAFPTFLQAKTTITSVIICIQ